MEPSDWPIGDVMLDAVEERPNWKGLADAVVVVVRDVDPPSMVALVSAGLPNEKTEDASESVLTPPPKENVGCCFDASSVVLAATPKANVGSFLSAVDGVAPKAKVVAGFEGSLNVVAAVVVLAMLEPNVNTDDAGAAVVVTFPNDVFSSAFLTASPNVKLRVLLPLSLVRADPNVPIVVLPKVGIFGASSGLGRVVAVVAAVVPKLKTEEGFSDVTASAFFSKELAPKANIAGRGAVAAVVVDVVVVAG